MKCISLTQGKTALVSDRDYPLVRQFKWGILKGTYARTTLPRVAGRKMTILMHRLIAGFPPFRLDHRNRNGFDNRRSNLRPATNGENQANSKMRRSTGGYKGVYRSGRKWMAQLRTAGQQLYFGTFNAPEEAAIMRNFAALHYHGDYAR